MRIELSRVVLSFVFLSVALALNSQCQAQLRSIMPPQAKGVRVAEQTARKLPPRVTNQRVMQVNQPSDNSSVVAASHLSEPDNVSQPTRSQAPSISINPLTSTQYGSAIAEGVSIFEVKNFGSVDARDVNVEISVEHPGVILSIEPQTTIIASRRAHVRMSSIAAGAAKLIKVTAAAPGTKPVQYTARILLETVQRFAAPRSSRAPEQVSAKIPSHTSDLSRPEQPVIIKVEAPKQHMLGVPFRIYATVLNPTKTPLTNLKLELKTSDNMKSSPGFTTVQTAERIAGRHSARFEFEVFGHEPGSAELTFDAAAQFEAGATNQLGNNNASIQLGTSQFVEVFAPAIRAQFKGPERVHVGTEATFGISVMNESGFVLPETDVMLTVPEGMVVTVLDRIAFKRGQKQIAWRVKNLEAGESELIQFKAEALEEGFQNQEVNLTIQQRLLATNNFETEVMGPSQLEVNIKGVNRAIPVGEVASVRLQIKNQDDYENELQLSVKLPPGVDGVHLENVQSNENNLVVFQPFVMSPNTDMQLEFPVVGSVIGGLTMQATVESFKTMAKNSAQHKLVFVNPRDLETQEPDPVVNQVPLKAPTVRSVSTELPESTGPSDQDTSTDSNRRHRGN